MDSIDYDGADPIAVELVRENPRRTGETPLAHIHRIAVLRGWVADFAEPVQAMPPRADGAVRPEREARLPYKDPPEPQHVAVVEAREERVAELKKQAEELIAVPEDDDVEVF